MAQSLLLLRRISLSSKSHNFLLPISSNSVKCFSASTQPSPTEDPPKPSSLSTRMSFVFDQIDQIEKQKRQQSLQNDETLQRIRSWRQSRKEAQEAQKLEGETQNSNQIPVDSSESRNNDALERIRAWRQSKQSLETKDPEVESPESGLEPSSSIELIGGTSKSDSGHSRSKAAKEVELVHPWPEWIELMERLVQQNYFDHKRRDKDMVLDNLGYDNANVDQHVSDDPWIDFKDFKTVQTACLNFGKDRFDILRSLSRQNIQVLVGYGCPSADKKVAFSAKLLRKRVHLDEGDVCSSCNMRSSCERAYLLTDKEDEARTIDLMRVLLTYSFHSMNGCMLNKPLLKQKSVKTVVRKLLHEVVKLSSVPIDPNLPPPVIKKPQPKVKQPPPPPKKRVGRDDVEMKKGDWLCPKCDFMNFAKNTVCLQCDAKRPKRQLLPGEWECPECNFLNYRRNMACFHCDCKRPPDAFTEHKIQEVQHDYRPRLGKVSNRAEVSNAWNFDFDDDESDGADVAAFEYADSPVRSKVSPQDSQGHGIQDGEYSDLDSNSSRMGFDDFDDEDDVDSYEIDTQPDYPVQGASHGGRPEVERFSGSEDVDSVGGSLSHCRTLSSSRNKPSKSPYRKMALSDSEFSDSEEDLSVHSRGKSSSVSEKRKKSTRTRGPSKGLSFVSDEELELDSDVDDEFDANFGSRNGRGNRRGNSTGNLKREGYFDGEHGSFSGSEFDSDEGYSRKSRSRGSEKGYSRREENFSERGAISLGRNSQSRSNNNVGGTRNRRKDDFARTSRKSDDDDWEPRRNDKGRSNNNMGGTRNRRKDDFARTSRKSYDDDWEPRRNDKGRSNIRGKGSDIRNFEDRRRGGGFRDRPHGKYGHSIDMDRSPSEFPNSKRVIER